MVTELKRYNHTADNPPWTKARAEVRHRATRERLNKPDGIGGGGNDRIPEGRVFSLAFHEAPYCSDDAVAGVAGPDGDLSCRVAREGLPSLAS